MLQRERVHAHLYACATLLECPMEPGMREAVDIFDMFEVREAARTLMR
jgi:hypothetical protein